MESNSGSSCSSSNKGNEISKQRIIENTSDGVDYISNLPEVILLHILSFLPLKEWIVVSLLSRRWKYLWTKISSLNLDELEMIRNTTKKGICCTQCGEFHGPDSSYQCLNHSIFAARRKFVEIVDRMLLLHSGCTIDTMRLCFFHDLQDGYSKRIDTWVRYALTSNIKELDLNFGDVKIFNFFTQKGLVRCNKRPQLYKLPCGLFAPKTLKTFILNFCKFRASSFYALSSLQRLHLMYLKVLDCSIAEIAFKCPVLENLILEYCLIPDGFFVSEEDIMIKRLSVVQCTSNEMLRLDISTPNLLMLTIEGNYLNSASIRKATHLIDAQISFDTISAHNADGDALNSLLSSLNHCQSLTLSNWCIQVTPIESTLLQRLHIPLQKLKHLKLTAGISKKEIPRLSCLLRSCPNLESLTIILSGPLEIFGFDPPMPSIYNFDEQTYWESQTLPFPCLTNSLKEIIVIGLIGRTNEVQMIMFLLKNAINLEKAVFSICGPDEQLAYTPYEFKRWRQNLSQMFDFIQRSVQAEVVFDTELIDE